MEFKNLSELYSRIKPALISKKSDLKRVGINYVKEEDIWNYLKETKWVRTSNLSLSEMVSDIFNVDNYAIEKYVKTNISNVVREVNLVEETEEIL
ncbi:MAG TPA: hypothetical protein GXZ95_04460 [Mollicutes bacterium]|nr:hypothetical protein [Mollicutes bacterium]